MLALILLLSLSTSSFASSELKVNISDGETIAGEFGFLASGGDDIRFAIDGKTVGAGETHPTLWFATSGVEYKGATLYLGKREFKADEHNVEEFQLSLKKGYLESGEVILTYVPWSDNFFFGEGTEYGKYNLDDQSVAKISMILPSGEAIAPDELILHYPTVGSGVIREERVEYNDKKSYAIGDGWSATTGLGGTTPDVPIYISFVFKDLLNKVAAAKGFLATCDTTKLSDGEHTLTLTCGNAKKDVGSIVDNTAPTISLPFSFGDVAYRDTLVEVSATDSSGDVTVKADVDGKAFVSGRDLSRFNLGKHLLTVAVTVKLGNSSVACVEFTVSETAEELGDGFEAIVSDPKISGDSAEYVYNVGKKTKFTFEYLGTSSERGEISILVFDNEKGEYTELATAFSDAKCVVTVDDTKYIADGEVRIKVLPKKYVSVSDTVVWITDTQYYSKFENLRNVYDLILEYSVGLFKEDKAGYLIHTGDIVDTPGSSNAAILEWAFASKSHKILDKAGLPYGVLAGNHDTNNFPPDLENYKKNFGSSRFDDTEWYGGNIDNNTCHYDLLTIAGVDYLFLYLSNGVEAEQKTIAWANAVLKGYRDRTAIICTHAYLGANGKYVENSADPTQYNDSRAEEIIENIIKPNENVVAVLCGHDHGAVRKKLELDGGRYVWEILSDYQYAETGKEPNNVINGETCDGEGYLRLITFEENGAMHQTTYSPLHDDYNFFSDDEDTFSIELQKVGKNVTLTTQSATLYVEADADSSGQNPITEGDKLPIEVIVIAAVCVLAAIGVAVLFIKKKK